MIEISPFTQYFVRRLLRHYLDQWKRLPMVNVIQDAGCMDVQRVLQGLCQGEGTVEARLHTLEALIAMYGDLERQAWNREMLESLEKQILKLLGLRLGEILPTTLPLVVSGEKVMPFKFCLAEALQEGIYYDREFYGLVKTHDLGGRLQMQRMAWALAQQQVACILVQEKGRMNLWVNVRSPAASALIQRGPAIMAQLMKLHPWLCRSLERQSAQGNATGHLGRSKAYPTSMLAA
jgi:hypothetical protein